MSLPPITPDVWKRMAWHPKAQALGAIEARVAEVQRTYGPMLAAAREAEERASDLDHYTALSAAARVEHDRLARAVLAARRELESLNDRIVEAGGEPVVVPKKSDHWREGRTRLTAAYQDAERARLSIAS